MEDSPEEEIPQLFPDHPQTEPGEGENDSEGWASCEEEPDSEEQAVNGWDKKEFSSAAASRLVW